MKKIMGKRATGSGWERRRRRRRGRGREGEKEIERERGNREREKEGERERTRHGENTRLFKREVRRRKEVRPAGSLVCSFSCAFEHVHICVHKCMEVMPNQFVGLGLFDIDVCTLPVLSISLMA